MQQEEQFLTSVRGREDGYCYVTIPKPVVNMLRLKKGSYVRVKISLVKEVNYHE